MDEVADFAGVSIATVSRVLSRPDSVSELTRRRVLEAVRELDYAPNASARMLRKQSTGTILVAVPYIANPLFSSMVEGIHESVTRAGFAVVLGETHHGEPRERLFLEMIHRREVDGLILLGHHFRGSLADFRNRKRMPPVVLGGSQDADHSIPSVYVDNQSAAHTAMAHLYGLGHRRIGVIAGRVESPISRDRLLGARRCAREHESEGSLTVVEGDFTIESGIHGAERLLSQPSAPTAILCINDEMAIGVLEYARRHSIPVPEQLSVVGFDDIRFAQYVQPALTTISQPVLDIGREAVRLLLKILQANARDVESVELGFKLTVRGSTAQPAV